MADAIVWVAVLFMIFFSGASALEWDLFRQSGNIVKVSKFRRLSGWYQGKRCEIVKVAPPWKNSRQVFISSIDGTIREKPVFVVYGKNFFIKNPLNAVDGNIEFLLTESEKALPQIDDAMAVQLFLDNQEKRTTITSLESQVHDLRKEVYASSLKSKLDAHTENAVDQAGRFAKPTYIVQGKEKTTKTRGSA